MTASKWVKVLTQAMKDAGTYRSYFDTAIHIAAEILEKRDETKQIFEESGGGVIVEHMNRGGGVYLEQNPAVRLMNDLNKDALTWLRDLGLTSKGYKQITEKMVLEEPEDPLDAVLRKLGV